MHSVCKWLPRFFAHSVSRFTPLVSMGSGTSISSIIGESRTGHEYILKDDFSGYIISEAVQEC